MVELINYFNAIHPLTAEAIAALIKLCRVKELRRGQVWLQEGAVCDKLTFVVKGLLKLYFETGSKEVILSFAKEKEFLISAQSYFDRSASPYTIRSVEPTVLVYIMRNDIENFLEKYQELQFHLLLIAQRQIADLEYHSGLLMLPRKDRFDKIAIDHPFMVDGKIFSDRMLAGYLGMTANALCTLKQGK